MTTVIMVQESERKNGMFDASLLDGTHLCRSSSPFIAAAAILLGRGFDPNGTIVMRRSPDGIDALHGQLGAVAALAGSGHEG